MKELVFRQPGIYWTRQGGLVYIPTHLFFLHGFDALWQLIRNRRGKTWWLSGSLASWDYSGRCTHHLPHNNKHRWDIVGRPASRERIVFPHPSTCPRWFDALKARQAEMETVLFAA